MKRGLLSLVPWMAIGAAAAAQSGGPRPAEAVFAFAESKHLAAFRVGSECYVAASSLSEIGWKCRIDRFQAEVGAGGQTVRVTFRVQGGKEVVPLGQVLRELGGGGSWRDDDATFDAYSIAKSVAYKRGQVEVVSGMPVRPKMSWLDGPSRLVLDFEGLRISDASQLTFEDGARAGQYQPNTVRLVVPLDDDKCVASKLFEPTDRFRLSVAKVLQAAPQTHRIPKPETIAPPKPKTDFNGNSVGPPKTEDPPASKQSQSPTSGQSSPKADTGKPASQNPPPTPPRTAKQGGQVELRIDPPASGLELEALSEPFDKEPPKWNGPKPAKLLSMGVAGESSAGSIVVLRLSGPLARPPLYRRPAPDVFEMILPGAVAPMSDLQKPASKYVRGFSASVTEEGLVFRFELTKPLGMQVGNPPNEVHLALIEPKSGNGSLAGKVIVVDAGHGGPDTGARSPDKTVREKDLTLAIATLLANKLGREGATVVMTRKTDILIPLKERPEVGNRNGAAFFVSVHINSNTRNNSSSGGISFYHAQDPVSMLLAECIQAEIAKVSGLPTLGAWSDTRIYDSGFAVLRYAKMPAVLLELGFINHRTDRAVLLSPVFQEAATNAIVKGLKVYLGHGQE